MARLEEPTRETQSPEAQATWDQIAGTRGTVRGPFAVLMHAPALAGPVAEVGTYLRFQGLLSGADRELAICASAREAESRYEWQAHAPLALKEGTRREAIEIVRSRGPVDGLTPRERTIVEVVRSLFRQHHLPDALYTSALADLGREQLVELVALAGFYKLIGAVLNGFEVDLPAGAGETF